MLGIRVGIAVLSLYVGLIVLYELCLSVVTEILHVGAWEELMKIEDPQLQSLVQGLKGTVMKSRAGSTIKKYTRAFLRWKDWADSKEEIQSFPVIPLQFALYLQHLAVQSQSKAAVEEAANAVSWFNQSVGLQPINHDPFVRTVLAGLQRALAKPKKKKEPITPAMLKDLVDAAGPSPSLTDARTIAIALTAFSAFLRFDEVVCLRCCDVQFWAGYMVMEVLSSKTDQLRQGDEVVVVRSGSATCPVVCLKRYCKLAGIDSASTERLFRAISHTRNGEKLRNSGALSYSRVRELLLDKLQYLGYDRSLFGTHSFRAGGATIAANQGVPDRMFKRHGRWRSETAKDGYVKDSLDARLEVSRKLGL